MIDFIKWIQKEPEKIGFEDIKQAIRQGSQHHLLINTMTIDEQECLISATLPYDKEEMVINKILEQAATTQAIYIIVYGKNSVDDSAKTKAIQLRTLGFKNVFIYSGGLFEWLLLQDIYGTAEFPTTSITKDLLKYRAHPSVFSSSVKSLTY
jgi:3-mercaptopyruvate sulfurtransferase SseA